MRQILVLRLRLQIVNRSRCLRAWARFRVTSNSWFSRNIESFLLGLPQTYDKASNSPTLSRVILWRVHMISYPSLRAGCRVTRRISLEGSTSGMWRNRGIDGILSGSAGLLGTWKSSLGMWLTEEGIVYFVFEKDQLLYVMDQASAQKSSPSAQVKVAAAHA